ASRSGLAPSTRGATGVSPLDPPRLLPSLLQMTLEAGQAVGPALVVQIAGLRLADSVVDDDDFGAVGAGFETDGDAFAGHGSADSPGVDERAGRVDRLEFAGDGHHASVGKAVVDAPRAADSQVDLGGAAADAVSG